MEQFYRDPRNVINISTSDFAKEFFRTELVKYANLVKKAGVEAQ